MSETQESGFALFDKDRRLHVSDGTPIAYTVRGSGERQPTVVLANGWSCSDAYWAYLLPALEQRGHRVVLPDTRGHGDSGLPREPGWAARNIKFEDMTVERIARDMIEVCEEVGVDDAVFIGHSMGVQTIFEVYRQKPELVSGLVTVAGAYENPMKTFFGQSWIDRVYPAFAMLLAVAPPVPKSLWAKLVNRPNGAAKGAQMLKAAGPKLTDDALAPYLAHFATRDPLVLFKALDGMRRNSAGDLLPDVRVPVLVLIAEDDKFTPAEPQRRMHALLPDSEILLIPNAGHTLPVEEPEVIEEAVTRFLDRIAHDADARAEAATGG